MRALLSIATRDHLYQTEILGEGAAAHAPGLAHLILVPDADERAPPLARATTVPLARIVPNGRVREALAFRYTPFELCCALKPVFAAWALRAGYAEVIYLDSDMEIVAPLPEDAWPGDASLKLTPHCLAPIPAPLERIFLRFGVFNAGYFAARDTPDGLAALDHWATQCAELACDDPDGSLFVDQLWLNLAPALFPASVVVSRAPSLNVGYWNFHERALDGTSVFHWSRWGSVPFGGPFRDLWSPALAADIDARRAAYAAKLAAAAARSAPAPAPFGTFADGRPITSDDRREFGSGSLRGLERPFASSAAFAKAARARAREARLARLAAWKRRFLGAG